jgi:hypothetical protein
MKRKMLSLLLILCMVASFGVLGVSAAAKEADYIQTCQYCGEGRLVLRCTGSHSGGQCFRTIVCPFSYCGRTNNYLGPCV